MLFVSALAIGMLSGLANVTTEVPATDVADPSSASGTGMGLVETTKLAGETGEGDFVNVTLQDRPSMWDMYLNHCPRWRPVNHIFFQVANVFFLLSFLAPHTSSGLIWLRAALMLGCAFYGLWAMSVECYLDAVVWNSAFVVINFIYFAVQLYLMRPIKFHKEIEEVWTDKKYYAKKASRAARASASATGGGPSSAPQLSQWELRVISIMGDGFGEPQTTARVPAFIQVYVALFKPLRVSRRQFRRVLMCMRNVRHLKCHELYAHEKVTKVDSLSLVLSGKLVVSQNQRALHIVFPHHFLDSPEWFGVSTDEYFQVSIMAMEESRVLVWHRDKLKLSIMSDGFLQAVFDHILGRDVVHKLMQVSETMGVSNGHLPNSYEEGEDKPMLVVKKAGDGPGITALLNRQLQATDPNAWRLGRIEEADHETPV